jgi:hypothetical protein
MGDRHRSCADTGKLTDIPQSVGEKAIFEPEIKSNPTQNINTKWYKHASLIFNGRIF